MPSGNVALCLATNTSHGHRLRVFRLRVFFVADSWGRRLTSGLASTNLCLSTQATCRSSFFVCFRCAMLITRTPHSQVLRYLVSVLYREAQVFPSESYNVPSPVPVVPTPRGSRRLCCRGRISGRPSALCLPVHIISCNQPAVAE